MSRSPALRSSLTALALSLILSACGGGGDAPAAPEQPGTPTNPTTPGGPTTPTTPTEPTTPTDPSVPANDNGKLLSSVFVGTFSATQITQAMSLPDSKVQSGVTPLYGVSSYRLTFVSTDGQGQRLTASGLVSVPVKAAGAPSPVLSYQHATIFHDDEAPSNAVEAVAAPIVLASLGYVVVSPDYVGFGASKGVDHPYLLSAPTAQAVIDMLTAAQSWRQQSDVADNGQLFLAGYSEGGYATMAAHRAIALAGGALQARLQASVPGAGPYDILATLDTQLARVRAANPILGATLDPGRLSKLPQSARDEVRRLLLRQMLPEDADVSYDSHFLDLYLADQRDLLAQQSSVHLGWAPQRPVYLFHGRDDQTVPYAASVSALQALQAAGASNVTLTDCTAVPSGHLQCVPEYFRFAVQHMGQLARDL